MKSITIRSARVRIHFGRYDRDLHPLYIFTLSLVCLIYRIVAPNTTNTQLFFSRFISCLFGWEETPLKGDTW